MDLQSDRMGGRFAHEIRMEAITPHLLWGTDATWSNFYVIRADNGKALFIDYPFSSMGTFATALHSSEPVATLRFIEHHLDELRDTWGVTRSIPMPGSSLPSRATVCRSGRNRNRSPCPWRRVSAAARPST